MKNFHRNVHIIIAHTKEEMIVFGKFHANTRIGNIRLHVGCTVHMLKIMPENTLANTKGEPGESFDGAVKGDFKAIGIHFPVKISRKAKQSRPSAVFCRGINFGCIVQF